MLSIKFLLGIVSLCVQDPQQTQSGIQASVADQPQQHSVLKRTGIATETTLSDQSSSRPVARVAQLPQLTESLPVAREPSVPSQPQLGQTESSRRQFQPLANQTQLARPSFEQTDRFQLKLRGADLSKPGQLQTFQVRLDNVWPSRSQPIQIQLGIPPGYQFADSDVPAQFDPNRNLVVWRLDSVSANTGVEINFRAHATGKGPQLYEVQLIQDRTVQSRQQLETFILASQPANRLPVQPLPSQLLPSEIGNTPMVAQDLPPIVQSQQLIGNSNQVPAKGFTPIARPQQRR
jgi:hypothetical protein